MMMVICGLVQEEMVVGTNIESMLSVLFLLRAFVHNYLFI